MAKGTDLIELRLDLIDRLAPYEITVKELYPFDEDLRALAKLPSKQRDKRFNELVDKIRTHYKKQKRVG